MTQKPNNPVVQQVRDAAAQAYRKIIPNEGGAFTFSESIEVGHEDDHWLVQAFAAHRQATLEEAASTRPARSAGSPPNGLWGGQYQVGWDDAVAAYSTALRALKEQP